ncbi:MAG: phenylacetate--CoA ligase family protein [Chitinophagaceae bacterium]|nr:phenylacetate--CoA ligase family protein [Chitinophagaceae bacterium]
MVNQIKDSIAYYSRHNFLLYRQMAKLTALENLDPAELRKIEEKEALKMIRFAAERSQFYKNLYKGINLDGPFSEVYPQLPVITKSAIRENEAEILTKPARLLKKAYTSGTSGSPLNMYRSAGAILKENAYVWQYRLSHGIELGDPFVSMRGVLDNKTLQYFNKAENTLYLSSYLLSKSTIGEYATQLNSFKPKAIFAFPSSLFTLSNLLEEAGLTAKIPLLFTSSETLYPFQREKIEQTLGGRIYDRYSTAERTILLHECENGNFHAAPKYGISEFLENGKGVVTTSLINKAFPLIKYQIDDTFRFMDSSCACGKGRGISSIEGRVDDVVLLQDGTRIGRLGVAFQGIPHLRYAQIVQENTNGIKVNMVTAPAFRKTEQDLLEKKLRQRLNDSILISFNQVEEHEIVKTLSGKFKLVISKVA